ncbi:hypothetical protein P872_15905 [Rhodonellum psychrophilum GCM71 = DSM 17998]|uniref:Uncharacterized protein n=2 Tax=Rhodonellum TaxID=336827 RepID=U5C349_9BACT|nr:hypothetical protein P872_15905 [Rhodonellum psychrophilum GCM71 = DSM 17998]SDZ38784.1 hypothetical protein SAMN05444412_11269 [Rhodonellum ikkaensis]
MSKNGMRYRLVMKRLKQLLIFTVIPIEIQDPEKGRNPYLSRIKQFRRIQRGIALTSFQSIPYHNIVAFGGMNNTPPLGVLSTGKL